MKKVMGLVMVGAALMLAGCSKTAKVPTEPVAPRDNAIQGKLTKLGATSVSFNLNNSALASAPVAADGSFTLPLPTADKIDGNALPVSNIFNGFGCTVTTPLTATDATARVFPVMNLRTSDNREVFGVIKTDEVGLFNKEVLSLRGWVHSDKATTITGSVNCAKLINNSLVSNAIVSVKLKLNPGWNVVGVNIKADGDMLPPKINASGTIGNQNEGMTNFMDMQEITLKMIPSWARQFIQ